MLISYPIKKFLFRTVKKLTADYKQADAITECAVLNARLPTLHDENYSGGLFLCTSLNY